jgi:hypothetical protein
VDGRDSAARHAARSEPQRKREQAHNAPARALLFEIADDGLGHVGVANDAADESLDQLHEGAMFTL